ncbi:(2Fe-2S)-binding protein [Bacillus sp. FJAT-29937]|uniref:(2Fe-2S)-binding protein n=1 Tax=Bacillus sp. FJAT-29937 TaxID=1720553 RepID=UPI00082D262D|nr:(2Fe-2S)-binding protein [Bacillus sp. FJAT-29937]
MHIKNHPYFGEKLIDPVTIYYEGKPLRAYKHQTIASALMANGIKKLGVTRKNVQARGLFCSRGRCCSCYMTVDGEDHIQTCMKRVEEGMKILPNNADPKIGSEAL